LRDIFFAKINIIISHLSVASVKNLACNNHLWNASIGKSSRFFENFDNKFIFFMHEFCFWEDLIEIHKNDKSQIKHAYLCKAKIIKNNFRKVVLKVFHF
jgi:hypothetical protein